MGTALEEYRKVRAVLNGKFGEFVKRSENENINCSINEDLQEGSLVFQVLEKADETVKVPHFVQVTLADTDEGWADYSLTARPGGPDTIGQAKMFFLDADTLASVRETARAFDLVVQEIRGAQEKAMLAKKWGA